MAKLGTESMLVIRLARERMIAKAKEQDTSTFFGDGYATAVDAYSMELLDIANELEHG